MNKDVLSTLFVGIDVSSASNYFCAINFEGKHILDFSTTNDLPSSELAIEKIYNSLKSNDLKFVTMVLESTNVFSFHIANLLASNNSLFNFNSKVFVINPKESSNFRKTYSDMDKTDPKDAFVLADNVKLLKKIARDSYRLDKLAYDPINVAISSSFNTIKALEDNLKVIDKAIEKNVKGLCDNEFTILKYIPGIGDVYAAGIISEIGSISFFKDNNTLAKYAGLTWRKTQSGSFEAETTRMTKTGNKYLRYYLIEAVSSVKNHSQDFKDFYTRKYSEVSRGAHKRALALSARKLVRLIFGLLHHNQLYSTNKMDTRAN